MGFIEELRRKKAGEEASRKQQALRSNQEQEFQKQMNQYLERRKAERIIQERIIQEKFEKKWRLSEEAEKRFFQSGIDKMIEEVAKLGGLRPIFFTVSGEGTYKCRIEISSYTRFPSFPKGGFVRTVYIEVEATPAGDMRFKGGFIGSSTVKQIDWETDKTILERSLGKAYYHPKIEIRQLPPPPPSGSGRAPTEGEGPSIGGSSASIGR